MPDSLVFADEIERVFGADAARTVAVQHATFRIDAGELIALTGPSGSGKSTLLHLIGGLDAPTSGMLSWPGLGARGTLRPSNIVNIFQGPSLIAPITVVDNVALPMLLAGVQPREAEDRAIRELNRLQIGRLALKLPEAISGGESQRVAIARALAIRPKLILADEPTGQLDSTTAMQVMDVLLRTARELGAALVVSTHDDRVAARLPIQWSIHAGHLITPPVDSHTTPVPIS